MTLAIFLCAVYGGSQVLSSLGIGQPIRALAEKVGPRWTKRWKNPDGSNGEYVTTFWSALVTCPPCVAHWVGWAFSLWLFSPSRPMLLHLSHSRYIAAEVDGLMACGVTFAVHYLSVEAIHALKAMAAAMTPAKESAK